MSSFATSSPTLCKAQQRISRRAYFTETLSRKCQIVPRCTRFHCAGCIIEMRYMPFRDFRGCLVVHLGLASQVSGMTSPSDSDSSRNE